MKRVLRIGLFSLLGLFGLFLLAAVLIPILFKDEINARVKKEINNQLEAVVDYKDFGLSLFSQFPYLSVQLEGLTVKGKEAFARNTLLSLQELQVAVNVMNVIRGEKLEIRKIFLDRPSIHGIVLADGRANWNITKPDTTPEVEDTTQSEFALALRSLRIREANVHYDDRQSRTQARIRDLNFQGNGDLTQDVFDFNTKTKIESIFLALDKTTYVNNVEFESKVDLNIDQKNSIYTFRDNEFRFNALKLGLDGSVGLPDSSTIALDVRFKALETEFRNILSLVPGVFTKEFDNIRTDGTLALDGEVKGKLVGDQYPTFAVNLKVNNGFMQYPDLPAPVKNIQVDVTASNKTSNLETTEIDLRRFHAELDRNPIDAKARVVGLSNPSVDGSIQAQVKLAEMTRIFPIEGVDLKGDLSLKASAKGKVLESEIPAFDAAVNLKYGYLKYADLPAALENMTLEATASSQIGSLTDTQVDVANFHAEIDKEPIDLKMFLRNLDDPDYRINLRGKLDLAKLTKIYPIENTVLSGTVVANLNTEGKLSVASVQKYDQLDAAGSIVLNNIQYAEASLPNSVSISDAQLDFTNYQMNLTQFNCKLGRSDVQLTGQVENYIGYLFSNQKLKGRMQMKSGLLDLNEWLTDSGEAPPADTAGSEPMEAPQIPATLDLVFNSNIGRLLYEKYDITNFKGNLAVRDQKLLVEEVGFDLLGGRFLLAGLYDSQNIQQPLYQFRVGVDSLQIERAWAAFDVLKKYVPVARHAEGIFGTGLNISGALTRNLDPVMESINAEGLATIFRTVVRDFPILNQLSSVTKLDNVQEVRVRNTKLKFAIRNGRLFVEPFDVGLGNYKMNVGGSNSLDGGLDYTLNLDVPAPALTQNAAGALTNLTGRAVPVGERVNVPLQLGGTFQQPRITGMGKGVKQQVKETIKDEVNKAKEQAKEQVKQKIDDTKLKAQEELDRQRREAEDKARKEADKKRQELEAQRRAEEERIRQEAERRRKEEEERLKKEAEQKLKDKVRWPR